MVKQVILTCLPTYLSILVVVPNCTFGLENQRYELAL